ncbi:hypothetical protein [Candidatus Protofrankia californiensis]|uniref:hypothetical protein n=1 Tax=Candidatus Protofrankia californiensis TaxID=1839754 RepID=UPI0010412C09|nr:hypothetical protein [Candidatus Protofrankia californiensis]
MPEMTGAGTLLISMPEIADLAAVLRPVVTTWRRRHVDFPEPVPAAPPTAASGRDAATLMFDA